MLRTTKQSRNSSVKSNQLNSISSRSNSLSYHHSFGRNRPINYTQSSLNSLQQHRYQSNEAPQLDLECRLHTYIKAYRSHGHKESELDPLGFNPGNTKVPELNPAAYGLHQHKGPISVDGFLSIGGKNSRPQATVDEITEHLRQVYCGKSTMQVDHLSVSKEYQYLCRQFEASLYRELPSEEKKRILKLVTESEIFDQHLHKKFPTVKRYGLEGSESMIVAMDYAMRSLNQSGVGNVVVGMPHRGRLNLLANVLGFPVRGIINKARGGSEIPEGSDSSGDVLSHLYTSTDLDYGSGQPLRVSLLPNPSHLEAVNPVAMGKAKSKILEGDDAACILVHGDAAFTAQGIVSESFTLSNLKKFGVNGTIHIVVNNQLGFTTPADYGRSSRYSADIGKMVSAPIFHANADHPEEVAKVMEVASAYRQKFKKDVIVELMGYRRWGHNELDEPAFTQPKMYEKVRSHPSSPQLYSSRLVDQGIITQEDYQKIRDKHSDFLKSESEASESYKPEKRHLQGKWNEMKEPKDVNECKDTGADTKLLEDIGYKSIEVPNGFNVHERLKRFHIRARREKLDKQDPIDWATAEAMAMGSLLMDGYNVRISGQDVARGTFSQRHFVMVDQETEERYVPLKHLPERKGRLDVALSPLSELAVLGFEYGYSLDNPNNLAIWEAQFGDFANGAQVVIDNFIASGEDKWLLQSGLVMLLPHGLDGGGPEHSSGRPERFLQLASGNVNTNEEFQNNVNMHVINPTTPANYFHALRRQMHRSFRKPLIVMSPKAILKHSSAVSSLNEMAPGTKFQPVLSDSIAEQQPDAIEKVAFMSGKLYYDLAKEREKRGINNVALIRLEELSPFPYHQIESEIAKYPNASKMLWVQEEHENLGGYLYAQPRLQRFIKDGMNFSYVGRSAAAVSAVGLAQIHKKEIQAIHDGVFS
eukprot:gb/GECH01013921.1/.p1 GENE.gb/GECH01013921.1/~~gb/GECH01013921.1/.p1  ORF type:complete len:928 (+),score=206.49 gb/GECH01013921.1/:1-2784(+)